MSTADHDERSPDNAGMADLLLSEHGNENEGIDNNHVAIDSDASERMEVEELVCDDDDGNIYHIESMWHIHPLPLHELSVDHQPT